MAFQHLTPAHFHLCFWQQNTLFWNKTQSFPNPNHIFLVPKPVETVSTGRLVDKQTASFNELKIQKVQKYKQ